MKYLDHSCQVCQLTPESSDLVLCWFLLVSKSVTDLENPVTVFFSSFLCSLIEFCI
jgi:hypothetical protein